MRRMSLAEQVQLQRADEQMTRPSRELLFDNAFQRSCSDGYWRGKLAKAQPQPNLLRGQLTLFTLGTDGKVKDRSEARAHRARGPRLRDRSGSGWLVGFEDAARAG